MRFRIFAVVLFLLSLTTGAYTQCLISAEKKELINDLLCGRGGTEYPVYGDGCVKKSAEMRLLDSAKQYWVLKICGFHEEANILDKAFRNISREMTPLLACSSEKLDYAALYERVFKEVEVVSSNKSCTATIRQAISSRKDQILKEAESAGSQDIRLLLEQSLKIKINHDGSITEAN